MLIPKNRGNKNFSTNFASLSNFFDPLMTFCNKTITFGSSSSQFIIIMKFLHSAFVAAVMLLLPFAAFAIPARQGVIVVSQPDGTQVSVMLHGDENGHYATDTQGNLAVEAPDGFYRYAASAPGGLIVPSAHRLTASGTPSAEARAFLAGVDRDAMLRAIASRRSARIDASRAAGWTQTGLMTKATFPHEGSPRSLVILVEYSNLSFRIPDPYDYFRRLLTSPEFNDNGADGSALEWFTENSSGRFTPQFDVVGPITLPHSQSYYGKNNVYNNDANPTQMVIDACKMIDEDIDFREYDVDGDGFIDNVFVFYAGLSEAEGGGANCVWPHHWSVYTEAKIDVKLDGVRLNDYACSNEWHLTNTAEGGMPTGIGTFCHEFGHVLGLPDLYSTRYTGAITLGDWDVMDHGSYNNEGMTPPLYSAYERHALGWLTPRQIKGDATITLRDIADNTACIIPTARSTEFFLLENRQQTGWNRFVPGHGMLVWHVDYVASVWDQNSVNNSLTHQYVDLEEADGSWSNADNRAAHCFPGTAGITSITDNAVTPSLTAWDGTPSNRPITGITESADGLITFNVGNGAAPLPALSGLKVATVTPYTATVKWETVPSATGYRVSLALKGEKKHLAAYRELLVTSPQIVLEGLTPETDYTLRVRAENDGSESPEATIDVTSGMLTFDYRRPGAGEATDITATSFTANWHEMAEADDYLLTVYTRATGNTNIERKSFDTGLADITRGWSANTGRLFDDAENAGQAPPSLCFGVNGWILNTPTYTLPIRMLSFWYKGVDTPEGTSIRLQYYVDKEWIDGDEIAVTRQGTVYKSGVLPEGTMAVQFILNRTEGYLALDDIEVEWGGETVYTPLQSFIDIATGNVTARTVTGLSPLTDYAFSLRGLSGGVRSLESDKVDFTTAPGEASIDAVAVDAASAPEYFNLQGMRISRPAAGQIVIRRQGAAISKVLVR